MKFGTIATVDAVGAILAHGIKLGEQVFKKGRVLSAADVALLVSAGHGQVIAARVEASDVAEDDAARRVAFALAGSATKAQEAFTGRANVHADVAGVVVVDEARLRRLNHLDESLTVATLPAHSVVRLKQMVATVKVIPFAVPRVVLEQALEIIGVAPLVHVAPLKVMKAGLVITRLPQTKASLIAKSEEAIRFRLSHLGNELHEVVVCDHAETAVKNAISDLRGKGSNPVLVFGASAIVDRADVIPAALVGAGGEVVHLGMPVDPGNLMMLGRHGDATVIGVPSCARSPKTNGFDWVLERTIAGIRLSREDVMDMGAGGLLAEIASRPQPREKSQVQMAPRIAGVVLAAGLSSRMGSNKMLADYKGEPMLRACVKAYLESGLDDVVVVTGHEAEKVAGAMSGLKVKLVHNPLFATGLASSVRAGVEVAKDYDAAVIGLGDMPLVSSQLINRLIAAFNPVEHRSIIMPVHAGEIGNPVLWGADHFDVLLKLEGDRGARALIAAYRSEAVEVEAGDDGVLLDADTPEALAKLTASPSP